MGRCLVAATALLLLALAGPAAASDDAEAAQDPKVAACVAALKPFYATVRAIAARLEADPQRFQRAVAQGYDKARSAEATAVFDAEVLAQGRAAYGRAFADRPALEAYESGLDPAAEQPVLFRALSAWHGALLRAGFDEAEADLAVYLLYNNMGDPRCGATVVY